MTTEAILEEPSVTTNVHNVAGSESPSGSDHDTTPATYQGINISAHKVAESTKHLPPDQRQLIEWLFFYCREQKWTWAEIKQASGFDSSTLYRIWTDRYKNPKTGDRISYDGVCQRIERFKALTIEREAIKGTDFVETTVWERINWLCNRTFVRQKMGFIYGESHIGKTTCEKEFQRRNNHGQTIYAEMPPSSGVQLMLRCIARALFVPDASGFDNLLADVIRVLNPNRLLILDEFQRVFTTYQKSSVMRCMDTIRYIHDQTKCGLVLSATNVFRDKMMTGEFAQYLKQFQRRGLYEVQLPDIPPRSDLDLMSKAFGLSPAFGEAEEIMLHIAKTHGFGMFKTRLMDAAELAAKKKQTIAWTHFVRAHDIVCKAAGRRKI